MKTIKISKQALENLGSNSLQGLIFRELGEIPKELRIEFEQTNIGYRKEHNGPDNIIIPEFVPMCLCESIISLMNQGIKIEIGEYV